MHFIIEHNDLINDLLELVGADTVDFRYRAWWSSTQAHSDTAWSICQAMALASGRP